MKEYVPSDINVQELILLAHQEGFTTAKPDRLRYVMMQPVKVRQISPSAVDNDGYSGISSQIIRDTVKDWEKYRDFFLKHGIWVEPEKNFYIPGQKCKAFRLVALQDFQTSEYVPVDITSKTLANALLRDKNRWSKNCLSASINCSDITRWYGDITVDHIFAMADMRRLTDRKLQGLDAWDIKQKFHKGKLRSRKIDPQEQFSAASYAVTKIANSESIEYVMDCFGGRIHTPMSNITAYLRKYLRIKGQPFIGIDIKSSQPMFIMALLRKDFWDLKSEKFKRFREYNRKIEKHSKIFNNQAYKPLNTSYDEQVYDKEYRLEEDVQISNPLLYVGSFSEIASTVALNGVISKLCLSEIDTYKDKLNADIYTWLAGLMNDEDKPEKEYDRDAGKIGMMRQLFTSNKFMAQPDAGVKRAFSKALPTIHNLLHSVKIGNRKNLCALLQRIESYVVLHMVCPRLAIQYPHIPYFTIHDSVSTTSQYVDIVKQVMMEEIESFTGFRPNLKEDHYGNK